jgi:hypothetical protein
LVFGHEYPVCFLLIGHSRLWFVAIFFHRIQHGAQPDPDSAQVGNFINLDQSVNLSTVLDNFPDLVSNSSRAVSLA